MDNPMENISEVRSGEFVSKYIEAKGDKNLSDEAVQPNGVDLSIDNIKKLKGESRISNQDYNLPERESIESNENNYYELSSDESYVVIYDEIIEIPDNHIGLVYPRSRLMRCGLSVETAVWDSGYKGGGEGGLIVNQDSELHEDLRVAQIIFAPTEELKQHYDGSHQGERL